MDKIHLKSNTFVSRFTIKPERKAEFLKIWDPMWRDHIDTMNAITHFVFYGWGRDENELVAIESYKDEALLAELRKTPKFQELVGQLIDCCSKPMTMELFSGLETNRDVFKMYPKGPSKVHPSGPKTGIGTNFL